MGKDVLVLAEHMEGKLAPTTAELVGKAKELAAQSGGTVHVAVLGQGIGGLAESIAQYGVHVLQVEDPALSEYTEGAYTQVALALLSALDPRILLLAHTAQGYDLAPGIAGRADLPLVTNCVDLRLEGDVLVATRRLLNEKIQGEFALTSDRTYVATLRPGSGPPAEPAPGGTVASRGIPLDPTGIRTRFLGFERPEVEDIDIASADVIVAAGRGIQKKENLVLVERLAALLGGVVGASRPLTDLEWLPKTRQVGQSGKTVRPKLYVACGISGAMQHVAGMKDSGFIIAINTDPSAPIFDVAHVGVVANVLQLLPAVIRELGG